MFWEIVLTNTVDMGGIHDEILSYHTDHVHLTRMMKTYCTKFTIMNAVWSDMHIDGLQ
jgi:hypothetical protein